MSDKQTDYHVFGARDAREVSPLFDDVDGDTVTFACPSCRQPIPVDDLVLEGSGVCPGCNRSVQMHITSHDPVGGWRNIPEDEREAHR